MSDSNSGTSSIVKIGLTVGIIILAIPGLIIEPGPLSEMAALAAIGALWGHGDLLGGGDS